jgi:hypothetical protein
MAKGIFMFVSFGLCGLVHMCVCIYLRMYVSIDPHEQSSLPVLFELV